MTDSQTTGPREWTVVSLYQTTPPARPAPGAAEIMPGQILSSASGRANFEEIRRTKNSGATEKINFRPFPANTILCCNVCLISFQRLRRWNDIKPILQHSIVFAGKADTMTVSVGNSHRVGPASLWKTRVRKAFIRVAEAVNLID